MYAYPTVSVAQLHTEYTSWMDELAFYKEEIERFERQLQLLTVAGMSTEVRSQVAHFQNTFIRQKDVIERLQHNLHISEKQLSDFVKRMSGMGLSTIKMDNHTRLRNETHSFRKLFTEMKADFRLFEIVCREIH